MELDELRKNWNALGQQDPLWAILSEPVKRHNRWDLQEFFRIGEIQIDGLVATLKAFGLPQPKGTALDFGCGVGRLTQALLKYVDKCYGIDIAASMIEKAKELNRHGDRAIYVLNERDDLRIFPDHQFDIVYTSIVLQHMRPQYALGYIREFVRIIRPGGLAVFHVPGGPRPFAEYVAKYGQNALTEGLPAGEFRAQFRAEPLPFVMNVGQAATLRVKVRNASRTLWRQKCLPDARFAIRLGSRWFEESGALTNWVGERRSLDRDLAPGEETEVPLEVLVPTVPGRYHVEIDMVQEYVAWFRDLGSRPAVFGVEVVGEAPQAAAPPGEPEPVMEMYSIPEAEVVAAVTAAGGRVLRVEETGNLPAEYDNYYYVSK